VLHRITAAGTALVAGLAGAFAAAGPAAGAAPAADPAGAILYADSPEAVPGRYIVTLKDGSTSITTQAQRLTGRLGGQTRHVYDTVQRGYSASMTVRQAQRLAADPAVASVEAVQRITVTDTQNNPPNWGDDRIDQRNLPLNQAFTYPADPGQT
jgi:hypothetical protein